MLRSCISANWIDFIHISATCLSKWYDACYFISFRYV